jgi:hypothetical protein
VPGGIARAAEHHAPGQIGDPAPQLAIDEVPHPPGREPERTERGDEVHQPQVIDAVAPGGEQHRRHHPQQSAMERHSALPEGEDLERV